MSAPRWTAKGPTRSSHPVHGEAYLDTDGWKVIRAGQVLARGLADRKAAKAAAELAEVTTQELVGQPLVVSYGMGVDSTAVLVGLHERGIRPDAVVFADVGAEKPETYAYLETIDTWLKAVGFPQVTIVSYTAPQSTYSNLEENCTHNETLPSLAYGQHSCSLKWKIEPQVQWLKRWEPAQKAASIGLKTRKAIGYDCSPADLKRRDRVARYDSTHECAWYPLQDWGWTRDECKAAIERAGLPVPPKSACYFCPASKKHEVLWLEQEHPELLVRALAMEVCAATGKHAGANASTKGLGRQWSWADVVRDEGAGSFLV